MASGARRRGHLRCCWVLRGDGAAVGAAFGARSQWRCGPRRRRRCRRHWVLGSRAGCRPAVGPPLLRGGGHRGACGLAVGPPLALACGVIGAGVRGAPTRLLLGLGGGECAGCGPAVGPPLLRGRAYRGACRPAAGPPLVLGVRDQWHFLRGCRESAASVLLGALPQPPPQPPSQPPPPSPLPPIGAGGVAGLGVHDVFRWKAPLPPLPPLQLPSFPLLPPPPPVAPSASFSRSGSDAWCRRRHSWLHRRRAPPLLVATSAAHAGAVGGHHLPHACIYRR